MSYFLKVKSSIESLPESELTGDFETISCIGDELPKWSLKLGDGHKTLLDTACGSVRVTIRSVDDVSLAVARVGYEHHVCEYAVRCAY